MKKILLNTLLISSFLTLYSCGDKKEGRNDLSDVEELEKDSTKGLVVTLEGVFPANDEYQLFYSTTEQFEETKSIHIPVFGQPVLQKIVFEIPKNVKPQYIRLDYGSNVEQTNISIKNVEFSFNKETFNINNKDFYGTYFRDGQGTSYNIVKLTLDLKSNPDNIYDPFSVSTIELKKELNKIYNNR